MRITLANRKDKQQLIKLENALRFSAQHYKLALSLDQVHGFPCIDPNVTCKQLYAIQDLLELTEELLKSEDYQELAQVFDGSRKAQNKTPIIKVDRVLTQPSEEEEKGGFFNKSNNEFFCRSPASKTTHQMKEEEDSLLIDDISPNDQLVETFTESQQLEMAFEDHLFAKTD